MTRKDATAEADYEVVWRTKAAITRAIQLRQRLWSADTTLDSDRKKYEDICYRLAYLRVIKALHRRRHRRRSGSSEATGTRKSAT